MTSAILFCWPFLHSYGNTSLTPLSSELWTYATVFAPLSIPELWLHRCFPKLCCVFSAYRILLGCHGDFCNAANTMSFSTKCRVLLHAMHACSFKSLILCCEVAAIYTHPKHLTPALPTSTQHSSHTRLPQFSQQWLDCPVSIAPGSRSDWSREVPHCSQEVSRDMLSKPDGCERVAGC